MAKFVLLTICAILAGVVAEPPSSYLPPQARGQALSTSYGAPFAGGRSNGNGKASSFHAQRTGAKSFSYNSQHDAQFGGAQSRGAGGVSQQYGVPSQSYRAPGGANGFGRGGSGVSQQYGAPSFQASGFGAARSGSGISQQYGAPSFQSSGSSFGGRSVGLSQQYGAPASGSSFGFARSGNGLSQQYGAPSFGSEAGFKSSDFGVSQQYGAPSSGSSFGSARSGNGLSQQYGAPTIGSGAGFRSNGNGFGVSQQYGAPSFGASGFGGSNGFRSSGNGFSAPAPVYGVPSSRYNSKMEDDLAEPANYEYTYEVQAAEDSGAEFGHQESREDEAARGVYHVLLPDGRTQIVEYEADEEGFRPNIRYEESNNGYPAARGGQNGQGPY